MLVVFKLLCLVTFPFSYSYSIHVFQFLFLVLFLLFFLSLFSRPRPSHVNFVFRRPVVCRWLGLGRLEGPRSADLFSFYAP